MPAVALRNQALSAAEDRPHTGEWLWTGGIRLCAQSAWSRIDNGRERALAIPEQVAEFAAVGADSDGSSGAFGLPTAKQLQPFPEIRCDAIAGCSHPKLKALVLLRGRERLLGRGH